MNSHRHLLLVLTCLLVCASCSTTEPASEADSDPTIVVLTDVLESYEFREGLADSSAIRFSTSFSFSSQLEDFASLQISFVGEWSTGRYEIVNDFGGFAFRDTASMFSRITVELVPVDASEICLEASTRFAENGEYERVDEFEACCANCGSSATDLLGREILVDFVIRKSSSPTHETVQGMSGFIAEVRIEAIGATVADDDSRGLWPF